MLINLERATLEMSEKSAINHEFRIPEYLSPAPAELRSTQNVVDSLRNEKSSIHQIPEITKRSNDTGVLTKAESLRTFLVIESQIREHFAFNNWGIQKA